MTFLRPFSVFRYDGLMALLDELVAWACPDYGHTMIAVTKVREIPDAHVRQRGRLKESFKASYARSPGGEGMRG